MIQNFKMIHATFDEHAVTSHAVPAILYPKNPLYTEKSNVTCKFKKGASIAASQTISFF